LRRGIYLLLPTFVEDIAGEDYWKLLGALDLESSLLIAPFEIAAF